MYVGIQLPNKPGSCKSVLAIDFETANRQPDSGCAIGVALIDDARIVASDATLFRPFTGNSFCFTDLHGIRWQDVKNLDDFSGAWKRIAPLWEQADIVIAHNAPFDMRVLFACARRAQIVPPPRWHACTVTLARRCWPEWRDHKLSTACENLRISLRHHEAGSDAAACAELFLAAMKVAPRLRTQAYKDWTADRLPDDHGKTAFHSVPRDEKPRKARVPPPPATPLEQPARRIG
jgi:DNA polymerase-3 subunit epsilon